MKNEVLISYKEGSPAVGKASTLSQWPNVASAVPEETGPVCQAAGRVRTLLSFVMFPPDMLRTHQQPDLRGSLQSGLSHLESRRTGGIWMESSPCLAERMLWAVGEVPGWREVLWAEDIGCRSYNISACLILSQNKTQTKRRRSRENCGLGKLLRV